MPPTTRKRAASEELEDGPISKRTRRKIRGNFTIVSWNMQGGGSDVAKALALREFMQRSDILAICLQECGRLFGWTNANLPHGWEIAKYVEWSPSGSNPRCSLAILVRGKAARTYEVGAVSHRHRPVIGVALGPYRIFTTHLPQQNQRYLEEACQFCNIASYDSRGWVCVGDFNIAANTAPISCCTGIRVATDRATHTSGRNIDYGYISCRDVIRSNVISRGILCSDHIPIEFHLTLED